MKQLNNSNLAMQVEGKMGEDETYKVIITHEIGKIVNNALFRIGLLILLYRSPDLIEKLAPLLFA